MNEILDVASVSVGHWFGKYYALVKECESIIKDIELHPFGNNDGKFIMDIKNRLAKLTKEK